MRTLIVAGFAMLAICSCQSSSTTSNARPPSGGLDELVMTEERARDRAKQQVDAIQNAIHDYIAKHNDVPPELEMLTQSIEGGKPFLAGGRAALTDPWGQPFQIEIVMDDAKKLSARVWTTTPEGARIDASSQ